MRGWLIAEAVVAGILLVLSTLGIVGTLAFDAAELTFTFQGAIQAFFIFPGLVLSLIVNLLVQRRHGAAGLSRAERWVLGVEFALIAALLVFHFWQNESGSNFGLAIVTWPLVIGVAIAVLVLAIARNVALADGRAAAVAPPPPSSSAR